MPGNKSACKDSRTFGRARRLFLAVRFVLLIGVAGVALIGVASQFGFLTVTQTLNPAHIGHDGGAGWVYYNFSERSDITDVVRSHQDWWTRSGLFFSEGDDNAGDAHGALRAALILWEDDRPLGPAHAFNDAIHGTGAGAYSFRAIGADRALVFSTSDNSDPRSNGRQYVIRYPVTMAPALLHWTLGLLCFLTILEGLLWGRAWQKAAGLARTAVRFVFVTRRADLLLLLIAGGVPVVVVTAATLTCLMMLKNIDLSGIPLLLFLAVAAVTSLFVARTLVRWAMRVGCGRRIRGDATGNAALVVASVFITLMAMEGVLHLNEVLGAASSPLSVAAASVASQPALPATAEPPLVALSPEAAARKASRASVLSMPAEWARRPATVPGASRAVYWHGVLQVYDENGFRRTTPFPPKQPGRFRVMVVGDSLTYGEGIEERWGYTGLLNAVLGQRYQIEFLNLGQDGNQSEDVLKLIKKYLPILQPDLVFYGICLNDFLPSGVGEYPDQHKYAFPLPDQAKTFFLERLRSARVLDWAYDATLRRVGLRGDFFDVILSGFSGYQTRFAHDVAAMNALVTQAGIGPMMALVLDQYPRIGSRGHQLAKITENLVRQGGGTVIATESFYQTYNNRAFNVSLWEGHPDEEVNAIWADMIGHAVLNDPRLDHYRIGAH